MIYQKKQDSQQSPPSLSSEGPPFGTTPFTGEDNVRLAETDVYPADTLHFISFSYQPVREGMPLSGRAEIHYSLSEDKLVREAQFRERRIQNDVGESILGVDFHYFDGKQNKWVDEWDPATTREIPRAIEIELIIKVDSPPPPSDSVIVPPTEERRFKTIVEIPFSNTL